jgi:hypothetical protein
MSSSGSGQGSLDPFVRSGATIIAENPLQLLPNIHSRLPAKRARQDSDPESDDEDEANSDRMDFQQAENVTATQALGDDTGHPECDAPELPPPLSPEHAALRADFELITAAAMEHLYKRITQDVNRTTALAVEKATSPLHNRIVTLSARVAELQQQVITYHHDIRRSHDIPFVAPASEKKDPKKKKEKQSAKQTNTNTNGNTNPTYAAVATAAQTSPVPITPDTTTWTTLKVGGHKDKKIPTSKLIPTTYPQVEREVTCYFTRQEGPDTIHTEQDYATRQIVADTALRRVNSAIVDNKDVFAPAFIRARVTVRGNIIFTTGNTQTNVIYEDYTTILKDALSYYGECEHVEIGKRYSQFLLHGVPTHLSLPEISLSISSNYPQLIQGQTPRWLTPADRREHKANSTIVMTLTGNIKKTQIGRQHLIVCNRQCELDDYIAYGRSTQCRKCQAYGHPATLCRNNPRCAVCADFHETKEHPCALPICKQGPACTHPPIRCANCGAPHEASDPNCPERIKLREITKINTNTTTMGDAPEAGAAN